MSRPRHTRKDTNHAQTIADLREAGCVVIDVSNLPGDAEHNPLDLFVLSPSRRFWLQVELKAGPDAPFTPNEAAYLGRLRVPICPAYWSPIGPPVLVAYTAADVLAAFKEMEKIERK